MIGLSVIGTITKSFFSSAFTSVGLWWGSVQRRKDAEMKAENARLKAHIQLKKEAQEADAKRKKSTSLGGAVKRFGKFK